MMDQDTERTLSLFKSVEKFSNDESRSAFGEIRGKVDIRPYKKTVNPPLNVLGELIFSESKKWMYFLESISSLNDIFYTLNKLYSLRKNMV